MRDRLARRTNAERAKHYKAVSQKLLQQYFDARVDMIRETGRGSYTNFYYDISVFATENGLTLPTVPNWLSEMITDGY